MFETPETLRELLNKLLPLDEFDYGRAELWSVGLAAADAWEADRKWLDAAEQALRMLSYSPDGMPDTWPAPEVVVAALARCPEEADGG